MKRILIIVSVLIFGAIIFYFSYKVYLSYSINKAKKEHYEFWKKDFFSKEYTSVVFLIDTTSNSEYLKMRDVVKKEYINEGYLFNFSPSISKGDTLFKKKDSYNLYLLKNGVKNKLNYSMNYEF